MLVGELMSDKVAVSVLRFLHYFDTPKRLAHMPKRRLTITRTISSEQLCFLFFPFFLFLVPCAR